MSSCCLFQGRVDPEIRYIHEKQYIFPEVPEELLEPETPPEKRTWTDGNMQGEAGIYILELNEDLGNANNKILAIKEYLDKLEADIDNVHNSGKD
jgi:hypothetical protein